MSPAALRRYRAERMLTDEFQALKASVCDKVTRRLSRHGVQPERIDVEGCYALAWNGLYSVVIAGKEISNPAGWLVRATYRRAIEEHRLRVHDWPSQPCELGEQLLDRDFAQEIDDRARLRHLFEGMRVRLGTRERQAATLCYLQGLSRAEAAMRMGISERHMSRLMEGRGRGRPGVATQLGALAATIARGDWCEEQGSLIRALAFGILDPGGERHKLAMAHARECSGCRAYVTSVRGLAAILPPVFLPLAPGAFIAMGGGAAGAGGVLTAGGATGGSAASGVATGSALGGGASLGAKLAVGGLLAAGIGAGGVSLATHSPTRAVASRGATAHARSQKMGSAAEGVAQRPASSPTTSGASGNASVGSAPASTSATAKPHSTVTRARTPTRISAGTAAGAKPSAPSPGPSAPVHEPGTGAAQHEFGPEHAATTAPRPPSAQTGSPPAQASTHSAQASTPSTQTSTAPKQAAEQEFGIE